MSKNNKSKKQLEVVEDVFDFSPMDMDMLESSYDNDEMMNGMMHTMIEASGQQMHLALELTTLAITKSSEKMSVDDVFAAFKKAASVIEEKYPLNTLFDKFISSN